MLDGTAGAFSNHDEIALFDAMIDTAQKAFSTAYQEISSHVEARG